MAKPLFLLQGIKKDNDHESALKEIINTARANQIILSVAFVRENGVSPLTDILKKHSKHTVAYVGIRNGVTSAQGLLALLNTKAKLYVVDTGTSSIIFHPKVYLAVNESLAFAIIGSANLTYSGLNSNIEASTVLTLNRQDTLDEAFLSDLISSITTLQSMHPEHIFQIKKKRDIAVLLKEGRLEDERYLPPPRPAITSIAGKHEMVGKIKLFIKRKQKRPSLLSLKKLRKISTGNWVLIWISKGLTERDLNIPTGKITNPTGSMLFKKGQSEDIDQRHYFRDVVFAGLTWIRDQHQGRTHLERSQANFEIVVKGVSYGTFTLKLTHNSRTDTQAYKQKNAMTQIHWGTVKKRHNCKNRLLIL